MFTCKMNKGISNFKNVFDLYGQIGITEVYFDVKKIGVYIYATYDKSVHTMVTFASSSFLEYKCEKEGVFILCIKSMKENLKNITSTDTIELSIGKESDFKIKIIKKTIELEKKFHIKETQFFDLPIILDQVQPLNFKSSDFLEFCKSINGKYNMTVKTKENVPEIAFESDKSRVIIKSDSYVSDEILPLPFEGKFKSDYFSKLKKLTKFNDTLNIYINSDQPLILDINLGHKNKDKIRIWIKSLKQIDEEYENQTSY